MKVRDLKKVLCTLSDESNIMVRDGALDNEIVKTEIAIFKEKDGGLYTEEQKDKYKHQNCFDVSKLKKIKHPTLLLVTWEE